ncbi:MAG: hypothetical protein U0559_12210 [Anaerolineae bacterium]
MRDISLGRLGGLRLSAQPSALIGAIGLWTLLTMLSAVVIPLPIGTAVLGGLLGAIAHFLSELLHQLGHAWAARRTGYPMTGVRYWFVLGTSLYPPDEPALPGRIHIRRALGGPIISMLIGLIATVLTLILYGLAGWLMLFIAVDNFLILGLGAFLPLGFTDGSTILNWWGKP